MEQQEYKAFFLSEVADVYEGLLRINLNNGETIRIEVKDRELIEIPLKDKWEDVLENVLEKTYPEDREKFYAGVKRDVLFQMESGSQKFLHFRSICKSSADDYRWYTAKIHVYNCGDYKVATIFAVDTTEDMLERRAMQKKSEHDELTYLYSRNKLNDMLKTKYQDLKSCGVMYFDVDKVRTTNDSQGHEKGDLLICKAAESIYFLENSNIHAYRYGGDEFLVVACNCSRQELADMEQRWREQLKILTKSSGVECSMSLGTAWSEAPLSVEELISRADMELNRHNEKESLEARRKNEQIQNRLNQLLNYLKEDYLSIHEIDLEQDSFFTLQVNTEKIKFEIPMEGCYSITNANVMNNIAAPEYKRDRVEVGRPEYLKQALAREKRIEFEFKIMAGENIWVRVTFQGVEYREGVPVKVLMTHSTIDQGKSQMLMQQKAISDAYEYAEAANTAKTEFLSRMSHDIRTPLNAIIGMTAIANMNCENPQQVRDCLNKIDVSSKHLLALINEVLDVNKIEAGKMELDCQNFKLSDLIENTVTMIRPQMRQHNHRFQVNMNDMVHEYLEGDIAKIQQVIINLLGNAVKYTPDGGNIRMNIRECKLSNPYYGEFEFIIEDNGIGMTEEFQKVLFEPFSRAEDKRISPVVGSGLGMTITRNIIRMMDGDIKVYSKINQGTQIIVTIHLKLQDVKEESPRELAGKKVLVVDDEPITREIAAVLLNDMGMECDSCASGKEALEMLKEKRRTGEFYFVVLMDWRMPEMDGVAASKEIRERFGKKPPIILMSSDDWEQTEAEARGAGINGFVSKPLFRSRLIENFKELLHSGKKKENTGVFSEKLDFNGKKILLAEDHPMNAEIIKRILETVGIEVCWAKNGREAVEMMKQSAEGEFSLVFMDIQMPEMNGYEAAAAIRILKRRDAENIPIVALTANAFMTDIAKANSASMNDHLSKPIEFPKLEEILRRYLL